MVEEEKINIKEFIKFQGTERYRAFILHGTAGSGKSPIAKKIAFSVKGEYIDLLEEFYKKDDLKKNIVNFGPDELKRYLISINTDKVPIIIDNVDFLLNKWTKTEKGEFLNMIEKLSNVETSHTFVFVLQDDPLMETKEAERIINTKRESRIIDIERLLKIRR